jgi:hypothetical protein
MKAKFFNALSLALIMAMLFTSLALADNVQNDVVAAGNGTITAGGSTVVNYRINENNGDGQTGCNAADSSPATVTINTPAGVTVDTSGSPGNQVTLTFTSCDTNQGATFSSNAPGDHTITVSVSDSGAGTYNVNPATFTLHVNAPAKTTPTITWASPADITYGTALSATQLNATTSVPGTFTYSPAAGTVLDAGSGQTLHVDFVPNDTTLYNNASKDVTINVLKADPGCNISGYSGVYDGNAHGASGLCTAPGTLSLGASFTDVPGGTANWSFTASNNNYNNDSGSVAIEISKANASVNVSGFTGTYDGTAHGASGTATGVGGVDLSSGLNLGATFTNVPGGTANWTFTGGTNYNDQSGNVAITINKAPVTATAGGGSATYDGAAHSPSACLVSGAYTGDLSCVNSLTSVGPDAGTYAISPVVSGTGLSNFEVTSANGSYTINKAPSTTTVTCAAGPFYYTGSPITPCSALVTGVGGLNQSLMVNYTNNTAVGTATASATYGGDTNHNGSTDSKNFSILAWTLNGFYQPVDMGGVFNTVKGGSTVPLKFEVFAGLTELTSTSVVQSFVQTRIACDTSATIDEIEVTTTGGTSLRYDTTAGQFIQNWKTPTGANTCYRVTMTTADGSSLIAFFRLK